MKSDIDTNSDIDDKNDNLKPNGNLDNNKEENIFLHFYFNIYF